MVEFVNKLEKLCKRKELTVNAALALHEPFAGFRVQLGEGFVGGCEHRKLTRFTQLGGHKLVADH
jgi:hypothetical protein